MLTKDQILKSDDLPSEEVSVPEWGGSVMVRSMTGYERDQFEQSVYHENSLLFILEKNTNCSNCSNCFTK